MDRKWFDTLIDLQKWTDVVAHVKAFLAPQWSYELSAEVRTAESKPDLLPQTNNSKLNVMTHWCTLKRVMTLTLHNF